MARRAAKSRQTSKRATSYPKTSATAAAKKNGATRRAPANASRQRKIHFEVIRDEAESIHSDEDSQGDSGHDNSVDFIEKEIVVAGTLQLASSVSQTTFAVTSDLKIPQPAVKSPLDTACVCSSNHQRLESVTCVSDSDEDKEAPHRSTLLICPSVAGTASTSSVHEDDDGNSDINDTQHVQQPASAPLSKAAQSRSAGTKPSLFSPAAIPILGVSRLTDYFTYGIQAAMSHYADHLCEEEENGGYTKGPAIDGRAETRYRNNFLNEHSHCASARGTDRYSFASQNVEKREEEHFLEPQCTSLYRDLSSSATSQSTTRGSWSGATLRTATATAAKAPSAARRTLQLPVSNAFPLRDVDWKPGNAQASFREALHRAYACEDTIREWKRHEVNRQREQFILMLLKLKSDNGGAASRKPTEQNSVEEEKRMLQLTRSHYNTKLPSSLSGVAEYAQATEETPVTARTSSSWSSSLKDTTHLKRSKTRATKATNDKQQQCDTVDLLHAVGGAEEDVMRASGQSTKDVVPIASTSSLQMETLAASPDTSRHRLQVMDPSQLYQLHRPPLVLVDTLLNHHREAQQKQRAAQHAEDQAIHARRLYELPVLTEDIVRYVVLLLCLKRSHQRPFTAATDTGSLIGCGSKQGLALSPTANAVNTAGAVAASMFPNSNDAADGIPLYGEEGSMLYMKYPAPLLRTTSFAIETVRLLKWLRTWKNSSSDVAGNPSPPSTVLTQASGASQRKLVKTEVSKDSDPRSAEVKGTKRVSEPATSCNAVGLSSSTMEARPAQRSTVEKAVMQLQHTQQVCDTQLKQEKRSAFLKFFGAAVAPSEVKKENDSDMVDSSESHGASVKDGMQNLTSSSFFTAQQQSTRVKDENEEQLVVQPSLQYAPPSPPPPPPPLLINPAVYAYQLYCHAWKHAVRAGITPLATAAQTFAGSRPFARTGTSLLTMGSGDVGRVMLKSEEDRTENAVEAENGVYRGAYYEDAYGNRLRSARLALKEREKQEQLAAQQRRLAKKKGYFHRDRVEERAAGRSAAAMLEAVLRSNGSSGENHHTTILRNKHTKKRRRKCDSSGEDESSLAYISDRSYDDDENVLVTAISRGKKRKACARPRGRSGSSDSSWSSNSNPGRDGSGSSSSSSSSIEDSDSGARDAASDDVTEAKDEITNIAVVSGPTGSGKTAAVYVAAQLLGFRVVEMNASVRRCPKTVEHLLAELTRSYRLSGLRSGPAGFSAEEELAKLKQQHATLVAKARAEVEAAELKAEQKRKEARKANGISAQAVANFFSKGNTTAKAASKMSTQQQQHPLTTTNVDEVKEKRTVVQMPPPPGVSSAMLSPSPLPPTQTLPSSSPVGTRTLLLFEDADILLGDESARPFYAAIRDLAHRSKVPIVVTVSADPSPSQRYDTSIFSSATRTARVPAPLRSSYWLLCEEAGFNTRMDSLVAAYDALHASPVSGDRGSSALMSDNGNGNSGGGVSPDSVASPSGGNSPISNLNGTASVTAFFSQSSTFAACASTGAAGNTNNGAGVGSPSPTNLGSNNNNGSGVSASSAAANSLAARYTHMLLNAPLVSNFFGTQTPFTVVDALSSSSLYAQLLAVGAVELNLFHWQPLSNQESPVLIGDAASAGTNPSAAFLSQLIAGSSQQSSQISVAPSSSSWQQDMDRLTSSLSLRDPALFFELAARLRHALFGVGADDTVERKSPQNQKSVLIAEPTLPTALQCDAASRTTTDIRYWLNRLQMLLLSLQSCEGGFQPHSSESLASRSEQNDPLCYEQPPQELNNKESAERDGNAAKEDDQGNEGSLSYRRIAERLLEDEFQQYTSLAASNWDSALGRYMACLTHNELQSSRYEYWLLDDHVDYMADIVEELNTQDHPTRYIDCDSPPGAKLRQPSSSSQSSASVRRGRPPSSSMSAKAKKSGKSRIFTPSFSPIISTASPTGNRSDGSASASEGGLNPAWRALFNGAKGEETDAVSNFLSPTTAAPSTLAGGQPSFFCSARGLSMVGGAPLANSACAAGAVFVVPACCEWPPTLNELRKQASVSSSSNSSACRRRPVELLLPYSTAQAYYDAVATSASSNALGRIPDVAEPFPLLLGHDTPLRFVNRQGGREMIAEDGDYYEVRRELPASVHVTQDERFAVFRRWWRRTRKAAALRDSIAGRSAAALEDMLGYGCLMVTSSAATAGNSGSV